MPSSLMDSVRPLTTNIALEMGYAFGTHQEMLFATGVVLFTFILILNLVLNKLSNKAGKLISRKLKENLLKSLIYLSAFFTVSMLVVIVGYIFIKGIGGVNLSFLTSRLFSRWKWRNTSNDSYNSIYSYTFYSNSYTYRNFIC